MSAAEVMPSTGMWRKAGSPAGWLLKPNRVESGCLKAMRAMMVRRRPSRIQAAGCGSRVFRE